MMPYSVIEESPPARPISDRFHDLVAILQQAHDRVGLTRPLFVECNAELDTISIYQRDNPAFDFSFDRKRAHTLLRHVNHKLQQTSEPFQRIPLCTSATQDTAFYVYGCELPALSEALNSALHYAGNLPTVHYPFGNDL